MAYDNNRFGKGANKPGTGRSTGQGKRYEGADHKGQYSRPAGQGDKAQHGRSYHQGDKPQYGRPAGQGDKPQYGRPAGQGDKPQYGRPAGQGDRPQYGRPAGQGDRPQYGRPAGQGDRPQYGRPAGQGDRPQYGRPAGHGDRPYARFDSGKKPQYGRRFEKSGEETRPESAPRRATPPRYAVPPATRVEPADRASAAPASAPDAPNFFENQAPEVPENLLVGRNPIREALKAHQSIEKLLVTNGELTGSAREIVAMAREQHVVIQYVERARLDQVYPNHQGMLAYASAAEYASIEDILELAESKDEDAFVVVLDGVTDPHNLGAIIRSAECMGAHGVIIPERRSAGLNPAAVKAAAGALSHVKVARVINLTRTLNELKEKGLWITGAVTDGANVDQVNLQGPIALVIGSEGEGISPLVEKQCDNRVKLPMYGKIESLNASVAAGILLYEIARARHGA